MATTTYTHIELDLSAACPLGPISITDRINDVVPGLKTSTGKLNSQPSHTLFSRALSVVGSVARFDCLDGVVPKSPLLHCQRVLLPQYRAPAELGIGISRELHNCTIILAHMHRSENRQFVNIGLAGTRDGDFICGHHFIFILLRRECCRLKA